MKFLIVGTGSIGERHLKNLQLLGHDVFVYDRDIEKAESIVKKYGVNIYDFSSHHERVDAFVICTPPAYHMAFAFEALEHNSHMFIEKPLASNMVRVNELVAEVERRELVAQVGYQLRYNSALDTLKKYVNGGFFGRIMCIRAEVGQYLPDWHPKEDYRKLYTCYADQGGGIILDASHELDYCRWIANSEVKDVQGMYGKLSDLEMYAEDTAEINMRFENGIIANVHLDCTQRRYSRWCKVIGTKETGIWEYPDEFIIKSADGTRKEIIPPIDAYLAEMSHFISCVEGNGEPSPSVEDAAKVLEIALKAKGGCK